MTLCALVPMVTVPVIGAAFLPYRSQQKKGRVRKRGPSSGRKRPIRTRFEKTQFRVATCLGEACCDAQYGSKPIRTQVILGDRIAFFAWPGRKNAAAHNPENIEKYKVLGRRKKREENYPSDSTNSEALGNILVYPELRGIRRRRSGADSINPAAGTWRYPCRRRCKASRGPSWHRVSAFRATGSPGRGRPRHRSDGRARSPRHSH